MCDLPSEELEEILGENIKKQIRPRKEIYGRSSTILDIFKKFSLKPNIESQEDTKKQQNNFYGVKQPSSSSKIAKKLSRKLANNENNNQLFGKTTQKKERLMKVRSSLKIKNLKNSTLKSINTINDQINYAMRTHETSKMLMSFAVENPNSKKIKSCGSISVHKTDSKNGFIISKEAAEKLREDFRKKHNVSPTASSDFLNNSTQSLNSEISSVDNDNINEMLKSVKTTTNLLEPSCSFRSYRVNEISNVSSGICENF